MYYDEGGAIPDDDLLFDDRYMGGNAKERATDHLRENLKNDESWGGEKRVQGRQARDVSRGVRGPTSDDNSQDYAEGGAVDDDNDSDDSSGALQSNAGTEDPNTSNADETMQLINSLMERGRVAYGLPANSKSQQVAAEDPSAGAIPDDSTDTQDDGAPTVENPNAAPSFDEGGAVPESDDPQIPDYAPEPAEATAANMPQFSEPAQPQQQPDTFGYMQPAVQGLQDAAGAIQQAAPQEDDTLGPSQGPLAPVANAIKEQAPRILQWLQGAGAAAPEYIAKKAQELMAGSPQPYNPMSDNSGAAPVTAGGIPVEDDSSGVDRQVASQGGSIPDSAKLVEHVAKTDGPDAGVATLQALRQQYDRQMQTARAALRSGNVENAATIASNAYDYLPDGVKAKFTPNGQGLTATITDRNGESVSYGLSPDQFDHLINTGATAQYDTLLHKGGIGAVIKQFGDASDTNRPKAVAQGGGATDADEEGERPGKNTANVQVNGKNYTVPKDTHNFQTPQQFANTNPGKVTIFGGRRGPTNGWGEQIASDDPRTVGNQKSAEKRDLAQMKYDAQTGRTKMNVEQKAKHDEIIAQLKREGYTVQKDIAQGKNEVTTRGQDLTHGDRVAKLHQDLVIAAQHAANGNLRDATALLNSATIAAGGPNKLSPEDQAMREFIIKKSQQTQPQPAPAQPAPGGSQRQLSPQDQAAVAWARANPNHPKAKTILQLNGM